MNSLHSLTKAQVGLYNAALKALELAEVAQAGDRIDGAGWSSEIAERLGSSDYLVVAGALHAIVVSVEQATLTMRRPAHTFDAAALAELFAQATQQIANITERSALVVRIAPSIDASRSARDLAHVQNVEITATDVAGVMAAAAFQREGVAKIRDDTDDVHEPWADDAFRAAFVASVRGFSSLHTRAIDIPVLHLSDVRCFGTRILGGENEAWVFRDVPKVDHVVVVRRRESGIRPSQRYRCLDVPQGDVEVVDMLWRAKLLDVSHDRLRSEWRERPAALDYIRRCVLAVAAREVKPEANIRDLTSVGLGRLEKTLDGALPSQYWDLPRYAALLAERPERGVRELDAFVREHGLSTLLAHPDEKTSPGTAAALENLLAAIEPRLVRRLRRHAPVGYAEAAATWPEPYRLWAEQEISAGG